MVKIQIFAKQPNFNVLLLPTMSNIMNVAEDLALPVLFCLTFAQNVHI
jgi:hypothetical protein